MSIAAHLRELSADSLAISLQAMSLDDGGPPPHDSQGPLIDLADDTEGITAGLSTIPDEDDDLMLVRVSGVHDQHPSLEWCAQSELMLDRTHMFDNLYLVDDVVSLNDLHLVYDDVIVNTSLLRLLGVYRMWKTRDLKKLAEAHHMRVRARDTAATLTENLLEHSCTHSCPHVLAIFTTRRTGVRTDAQIDRARALPRRACPLSPTSYLPVVDDALRRFVIDDWQKTMTSNNLRMLPCAVCARRRAASDVSVVSPSDFDLSLLRNDALPEAVLPTTYAFDLYENALLYPDGMVDPWILAPLNMCCECKDELPYAVGEALSASTHVDKLLIARARSSRLSFRFKQFTGGRPGDADEPHPVDERRPVPQKFVRGNVLVMPQNSTQLNSILPPPPSVIRDTVCAVFVGRSKPTPDTIRKMKVLLARKSTVKTLIEFLVTSNPYYAVDDENFFGLSEANLDALFPVAELDPDCAVPAAMEIGFLGNNVAIDASTADYTTRNDDADAPVEPESLLMENVGYTCGDETPVSYRDMKMRALSHCLTQGRFICSKAGDKFVPDFKNPALLTWLFPHLDPWGIGGFHHPDRSRHVSMEQQLKYLLELDDGPFERDPDFAFVYFNILQKKAVCDSVRFRVKESQQRRIVAALLAVDKKILSHLIRRFEHDPSYKPCTAEEVSMVELIDSVAAVLPNIPGTTGYKLALRNEIRALVNFQGTPAFFVTLNPSDIHHPLVRLFAGEDIELNDAAVGEELSSWQRKLLVAKNPAACAKFFHAIISQFINVVLRYGKSEKGLFGRCTAYYGTVEAQARGTLHCHMLIWIDGHPSPQKMRDMMQNSETYKAHMFAWLESIIKSELLGTTEVVTEPPGEALPRPPFRDLPGNLHPGVRAPPSITTMSPDAFREQYSVFVNELVQCYNWHEHTETCWKYLRSNQSRSDENCRMRIDGKTRAETTLDADTMSIQLRRLHPRIANYNDLVMFVTQANMDVKHIGSGEGAKALIYYVTDYITKSSLPTHLGLAALMYAINATDARYGRAADWGNTQDTGALTIVVNSMLSRQEISHAQVMSHIVGGGDHYKSHTFRLLYYRTFERLVKTHWGELQATVTAESVPNPSTSGSTLNTGQPSDDQGPHEPLGDESVPMAIDPSTEDETADPLASEQSVTLLLTNGSISALNQQQDYLLRPQTEPFNSMSLFQFVGLTEKVTRSSDTPRHQARVDGEGQRSSGGRPREDRGRFMSAHPDHESHLVRKRVLWVVPVMLGKRIARNDRSDEERESWARTILVLFVPWRAPADLKYAEESWMDSYNRHQQHIPPHHRTIIANMNVLNECRDARDGVRRDRRLATAPALSAGEATTDDNQPDGDEGVYEVEEDAGPDPASLAPPDTQTSVATQRSPLDALTDMISVPARVALDRCFTRGRAEAGGVTGGSVSKVTAAQVESLRAEHSYMRLLKKNRRPDPVPLTTPSRTVPDTNHIRNPQPAVVAAMSLPTPRAEPARQPVRNIDTVPSVEELQSVIDDVIREYKLSNNPEQLRSFEIIARHVCFHGPQLSMYVGGVGGTGKSYVIQAILRLFSLIGRRNEILVSAPTGAAAVLIGGYTIHSLLLLPNEDNPDLQLLSLIWDDVFYLIIDEISMVSANLLAAISSRMQHAKGQSALAEDRPFGGVNVIFFGDFGQLRPVSNPALYSHRYIGRPTEQDAQHKSTLAAFKGVFLWRSVNTVVMLRKNQRQSTDAPYSDLLSRVREGRSGDARYKGTAYDFRVLQKRLIQNFDIQTCTRFVDAPVIVGRKATRDALNWRLLHLHADSIGAHVEVYFAIDKINGKIVQGQTRDAVWDLGSTTTNDSLGRLPLFPGMRVMIQENLAFAYHVVNGAVGTVRDIKYDDHLGYRTLSVVYVEIPGAGKLVGLPTDVVPVFPNGTYFKWTRRRATKTVPADFDNVARLQPPILPAYAYTDYKAQGRSLDAAIVDLDSSFSLQGAYVMLSRVRTLDGLAVLRPFRPRKIEADISAELRAEFDRLDRLDEATAVRWRRDHEA